MVVFYVAAVVAVFAWIARADCPGCRKRFCLTACPDYSRRCSWLDEDIDRMMNVMPPEKPRNVTPPRLPRR